FSFLDPEIPDNERLIYRSQTDGLASMIQEHVLIKKEGNREMYEITSSSPTLDLVMRIAKQTMAVQSVEMVKKFNDVTLTSRIDAVGEKPNTSNDEVKLIHYSTFKFLMRGFPFEKYKKIKISYYGDNPKKKFTMTVTCLKKEKLHINNTTVECHKLEFGLDGFWSTFLPRLQLWYSVDPPHYLVRQEGPGGPPGSLESTVELVERTVPASLN
ncbi:MAG: hypothetical protein WCQ99_10325, partial [Pseudomonadota bacterium]